VPYVCSVVGTRLGLLSIWLPLVEVESRDYQRRMDSRLLSPRARRRRLLGIMTGLPASLPKSERLIHLS